MGFERGQHFFHRDCDRLAFRTFQDSILEHLESILEHLGGFGHTVWPIGGPREVLGSRCKFLGYLMGYQGGLG